MAITTPTPTSPTTPTTTPSTGGLNYADYLKKIQTAAASTRDIGKTAIPYDVTKMVAKAPEGITKKQGTGCKSSRGDN